MDKNRLLETLDALRAELAQSSEVDPAMLAELRQLTDEFRQAAEPQASPVAPGNSTPSGLKDLLLRFEADHPRLTVSIGKVADALAAMGF
ncbi:MAG TPA: DUF4404 family protein [Lacipirellulaceae bacterium]|jgi:hypothetical protein|nr:DUF4404 family protein [Lacipirellulaceae bacterium]